MFVCGLVCCLCTVWWVVWFWVGGAVSVHLWLWFTAVGWFAGLVFGVIAWLLCVVVCHNLVLIVLLLVLLLVVLVVFFVIRCVSYGWLVGWFV